VSLTESRAPHPQLLEMCNSARERPARTNQSFRPTVASCPDRRTTLPSRLHETNRAPGCTRPRGSSSYRETEYPVNVDLSESISPVI
jgi:hypothetical protein